jgi:energy-coupling factor transporter ATP-binding protein EcfA2
VKIRSVELTNFRKFVGTVRVDAIGDNVNVLVGRNELGKSTLLQAINGVIFEKARSTASHVKAFRHFVNGTVPEVKLAFEVDGKSWLIHKRFAGQGGKAILTCSTGTIFEDDAAEAELQRLLGFAGGRGGGEPGIWGTLWVQQGQSFGDVRLSEHAQRTIQGCLEAQVGMVTGGARGQKIPRAVREALDAIQSQRGPRGKFRDAFDRFALLDAEIAELETKAKGVAELLISLASKRRELKDAQASWDDVAFRAELDRERERRVVAATIAAEIARAREAANLARERAERTRKTLEDRNRTIADLATLEVQREAFGHDVAAARDAKDEAKAILDAAERTLAELRAEARINTSHGRRLERVRVAVALDGEIIQYQAVLDRAGALESEVIRLTEGIAAIPATDEKVGHIENAITEVSAAKAAANAVSTMVSFQVSDASRRCIQVDQRPLGHEEKALAVLEPTTIAIENIGSIVVEPQIKDLPALLKRRQDADDALIAALDAAGVSDLAAAREAAAQRREQERALAQIRTDLSNVAPGNRQRKLAPGLEALKAYVSALRGELRSELEVLSLEVLPQGDALAAEVSAVRAEGDRLASEIATREAALSGPKMALADTEKRLRMYEDRSTALMATIGTRSSDLAAARANRSDDALVEDAARWKRDADEKEQDRAEKERSQGDSVEAIDARIKRLEGAAANHQRNAAMLTNEVTRLTALIQAQEGLGVEELLVTKQAERDRLRETVIGYEQEAAVLKLLLETLENAEREAKNRYLAPVVQRVQPYLKMILPNSDIVFDETLGVAGLKREGQTEHYGALSGGTQEQLAVLARIAFAELLLGQNRPAAVILDDALAFSDDDRIESMFDVLMRAGEKVQIIVLTCRKKLFARLGAAPLEISRVT